MTEKEKKSQNLVNVWSPFWKKSCEKNKRMIETDKQIKFYPFEQKAQWFNIMESAGSFFALLKLKKEIYDLTHL